MTLNELIEKCVRIGRSLTSGYVPVTINGKSVEIKDISLEGKGGEYQVNIKAAAEPQPALTKECTVEEIVAGHGSYVPGVELMFFDKEFKMGDKVIVQIRKK